MAQVKTTIRPIPAGEWTPVGTLTANQGLIIQPASRVFLRIESTGDAPTPADEGGLYVPPNQMFAITSVANQASGSNVYIRPQKPNATTCIVVDTSL